MDLELSGVRHAFDEHCDCYYHEFGDAGVNADSLSLLLDLSRLWNERIEGDIMDQKSCIEEAHEGLEALFSGLPTWAAYLKPTMTRSVTDVGPVRTDRRDPLSLSREFHVCIARAN